MLKWSTSGSVIECNTSDWICYIGSHWAPAITNSESITSTLPGEKEVQSENAATMRISEAGFNALVSNMMLRNRFSSKLGIRGCLCKVAFAFLSLVWAVSAGVSVVFLHRQTLLWINNKLGCWFDPGIWCQPIAGSPTVKIGWSIQFTSMILCVQGSGICKVGVGMYCGGVTKHWLREDLEILSKAFQNWIFHPLLQQGICQI